MREVASIFLVIIAFLGVDFVNDSPGFAELVHILSDEELVGLGTARLGVKAADEAHLLVIGGSEDVFLLSVSGEFPGEDFVLDFGVRPDLGDLEGDALVHHFCVQIFAFDFFLGFSGEKFNGVGVGEVDVQLLTFTLL